MPELSYMIVYKSQYVLFRLATTHKTTLYLTSYITKYFIKLIYKLMINLFSHYLKLPASTNF